MIERITVLKIVQIIEMATEQTMEKAEITLVMV